MPQRFKRRPSPSMVVALIALFVAMGGTAAAARILITSSKQLKNGVVHRQDLARSAVDSSKVANGSLSLRDLDGDAKGALKNAGTQALEAFRREGPQNVPAKNSARVATLSNIPPGVYAIFAKSVLTANKLTSGLLGQGASVGGHCTLNTEGDVDESRALLGGPGASSPAEVNVQITRTFGATGSASLDCDVTGASWSATNTSIIAIRVGGAPRQEVSSR